MDGSTAGLFDTCLENMDISLDGGQVAWSDEEEVSCSIFPTSTEFKSRYRRTHTSLGKGGDITKSINIVGGCAPVLDRRESLIPSSLEKGGDINPVGKTPGIDSTAPDFSALDVSPEDPIDSGARPCSPIQKVVSSSPHVRAVGRFSGDGGNNHERIKCSTKAIKAKTAKLVLAVGSGVNSDKVQCLVDCALIGRMEHVKVTAVTLKAWLHKTWKPLLGYTPRFSMLVNGWTIFHLLAIKDHVLVEDDIWLFEHGSIVLTHWHLGFNPLHEIIRKRHLWVILRGFPIHLWTKEVLKDLGNLMGMCILWKMPWYSAWTSERPAY